MIKFIDVLLRMMLPLFAIVSLSMKINGFTFELATCAAASECEMENAGCDHYCTETLYSYTCSCYPGYTLEHDGHTCIGGPNIGYSNSQFNNLFQIWTVVHLMVRFVW